MRHKAPIRPPEHPFRIEDREKTTILFGGLTWKHEQLIAALLSGAGYLCQRLPETDRSAHELGKEFCSSGLCNPVYFTVGNLIRFLEERHRAGLSRRDIVARYVYFTAACGGPCRFGMYESEFRSALNIAGYEGFRVLSFSQDHGIRAQTGHSGLQFSVDFGMHTLQAFVLGDLLNILQRKLHPFELVRGSVDRAITAAAECIADEIAHGNVFELADHLPQKNSLRRSSRWYRVPNTLGKLGFHLHGAAMRPVLSKAAAEVQTLEVDWLRPKPVVKVIGEFWAQMTESDGNFHMLDFLEKEGAEVSIEPISTWILYLLHQRKEQNRYRLQMARFDKPWHLLGPALKSRLQLHSKMLACDLGTRIYKNYFRKLAEMLRITNYSLPSQAQLAELAEPYFNTKLRGGEGHLEVGKTLYYLQHRKACHAVIALKPFGCLPSVQSDAIQAALVELFPDINFLSIETSAEGSIHAYSRVQMALSEARMSAEAEFAQTAKRLHHSLDEIRAYVAEHRELRDPFLNIPRSHGVISTAANFLLYADKAMSADTAALSRKEEAAQVRPSLESMQPTQEMKS